MPIKLKKLEPLAIILGAVLSVAVVFLSVFEVQVRRLLTPKAAAGQVQVFLSPSEAGLSGAQGFKIFLKPDIPIGFVHLEMKFDPALLKLTQEIELVDKKLTTVVRKTAPAEANTAGVISLVLGLDVNYRDSAPVDQFHLATVYLGPNSTAANAVTDFNFVTGNLQIVALSTAVLTPVTSGSKITVNPGQGQSGAVTPQLSPSPLPVTQPETGTPTWVTVGLIGLTLSLLWAKKYWQRRQTVPVK